MASVPLTNQLNLGFLQGKRGKLGKQGLSGLKGYQVSWLLYYLGIVLLS